VFLLLRHCQVLVLWRGFAAYYPSVYVDRHGEADEGLQRQSQSLLYLSAERMEKLQQLYASGGVAQYVSNARQGAESVIRAGYY